MIRSRSAHSSRPRRRLATTIAIGGVAVAGFAGAALPSTASANGLSTTISRWSSSDFTLGDAWNTTVTIAGGVDQVGIVGRSLSTTQTASVKLNQSKCTVVAGKDVLVTRALAAEKAVSSGVMVNPLLGSATVKTTIPVTGTETKTPAGTGGDCNELNTAGATTAPISDSVKIDASWKNKPGSSPLAWEDIYQQGVFYYRDAVATGSVTSTSTGAATLRNSTGGWLWSGVWVYATGT